MFCEFRGPNSSILECEKTEGESDPRDWISWGEVDYVQTYDRMRERRQDQLSYENQNPNTYGEHLVEGH